MNLSLLRLTLLALVTIATSEKPYYDINVAEELFKEFIKTHEKTYSHDAEKKWRLEIFKENIKWINYKNSISKAEFALNKFSDLTKEEFQAQYTGFTPSPSKYVDAVCRTVTDKDITTKDAPASLNWIEKGVVTPIKNQQNCGSCWAFSTIGNIESQYGIKTNQLKSLSEQELVDCSISNNGCNGGDIAQALVDLINVGGVESESSYSYVGIDQKCQINNTAVEVKIKGCIRYNMTDEVKFKEVLAKQGPISIAVNGAEVLHYHGTILRRADCSPEPLSHAVLLVGYGTENGTDYWLIKNSWGTTWGDKGYFKMSRGENTCGIMNDDNASAVV